MNTRDTFNVSVNDAEKQKKRQYEHEREKTASLKRSEDIALIKNTEKQREARTMLNARDKELADERGRQEELIQRAGDDAVSRDRLENHKFEQYAPEREDYVRTQIRQRMELDFAPENKSLEQELNRKIDDFVVQTIEQERKDQPQMSLKDRLKAEFKKSAQPEMSRDNEPFERKP